MCTHDIIYNRKIGASFMTEMWPGHLFTIQIVTKKNKPWTLFMNYRHWVFKFIILAAPCQVATHIYVQDYTIKFFSIKPVVVNMYIEIIPIFHNKSTKYITYK